MGGGGGAGGLLLRGRWEGRLVGWLEEGEEGRKGRVKGGEEEVPVECTS